MLLEMLGRDFGREELRGVGLPVLLPKMQRRRAWMRRMGFRDDHLALLDRAVYFSRVVFLARLGVHLYQLQVPRVRVQDGAPHGWQQVRARRNYPGGPHSCGRSVMRLTPPHVQTPLPTLAYSRGNQSRLGNAQPMGPRRPRMHKTKTLDGRLRETQPLHALPQGVQRARRQPSPLLFRSMDGSGREECTLVWRGPLRDADEPETARDRLHRRDGLSRRPSYCETRLAKVTQCMTH